MNRRPRLERIEEAIARTPDAGRTCKCPLPAATKEWRKDEGIAELVHCFTRPCPQCGLTRWGDEVFVALCKAYSTYPKGVSNE
jgi:hypothetical protein